MLASLSLQAPEGESQPSTEVDLFISTEKIMVLNTDLKVSYAVIEMRGCRNPPPSPPGRDVFYTDYD